MQLTKEQLKGCLPNINDTRLDQFVDPLNKAMEKYMINTKERIAAFLAQIGHESGDLNTLEENLNYSVQGLLKIFDKYFDEPKAKLYAKKPQAIANYVYSNRYGNGSESTGDGWKYRGRGIIQLTFKDNYKAASKELAYDLVTNPDAARLPGTASYTACWFWKSKGLNEIADLNTPESFKLITKRINGGYNHLNDRIKRWDNCKKVLNVK